MAIITGERVHLTIAEAQRLSEDTLTRAGYDAEEAQIIANHVMDAALCGYEYSQQSNGFHFLVTSISCGL